AMTRTTLRNAGHDAHDLKEMRISGAEDPGEVGVGEDPIRVETVAHGTEVPESRVQRVELLDTEAVHLAPVWPTGVRGRDLREGREVVAVLTAVVLVHGDVGVRPLVPGREPDVVRGRDPDLHGEGDRLPPSLDPRREIAEHIGHGLPRDGVLGLDEAHRARSAEDLVRRPGD